MAEDHIAEIVHLFSTAGRRDEVAEGLRLVKAFMQIKDPVLRNALLDLAERVAAAGAKNSADG
jgi:hypothetical protein